MAERDGEVGRISDAAERGGPGFSTRPHPLFVLFHPIRQYGAIAGLSLIVWLGAIVWRWAGLGDAGVWGGARPLLLGGALLAGRLVWAVLEWATRAYGVEGPVVWSEIGVLNRTRSEVPRRDLRSVVVDRPFFQRLVGLGSIGFATAGTGGFEVVWRIVGDPKGLAARARGGDAA